jgi:hypothetical protein
MKTLWPDMDVPIAQARHVGNDRGFWPHDRAWGPVHARPTLYPEWRYQAEGARPR